MHSKRLRWLVLSGAVAGLAMCLAACASGYTQFYQPVAQNGPIGTLPATGNPVLLSGTGRPDADLAAAYSEGLAPIGFASFNGRDEGIAGALEQAKKVGASHVIVSSQFARTVSGVLPLTLPQTYTSQTSGTVGVAGSGGYATGNYSGTTTTTGTSTTYIPYSVDRYDQMAVFLAPLERRGLGMKIKALTAEQAQALGTNKAVLVDVVRRGSPAFLADILPGDYLRSVNGNAVYDPASFAATLHYDESLTLLLSHQGRDVSKTIKLGPGGAW